MMSLQHWKVSYNNFSKHHNDNLYIARGFGPESFLTVTMTPIFFYYLLLQYSAIVVNWHLHRRYPREVRRTRYDL